MQQPLQSLNSRPSRPMMSPSIPKSSTYPRSGRENTPPLHTNIQIDPPSLRKKASMAAACPPGHNTSPTTDGPGHGSPDLSDPSVKVVVRIRPVNDHERKGDPIANKVSTDSLSVGDRTFTFHSVLCPESTQEDVFKLVGVPFVKNALAGFNTSILSYGETASGKTHTMWGPPSAMVDSHSISAYQGIVPRIFRMLFSEIQRKQKLSEEEQMNYQCRCSFLEIYNEQINDLLDPTQRNLKIRDDARNGFYIENLTDEYVTSVDDVTQILVKGLSNRKVGATSTNSKSSRSHIVFTCIIESWCKGTSSKYFSSSRTSRLSLIDLAGSDSDHPDGASRQCSKEGKHIKQSLSKLGRLVHILAEVSHSGNKKKIPYEDSCLTYLLKDVLGGNSKLTLICAISPENRAQTLSTLRFGERAREIQNKAVVNEITEDDVNGLTDRIRQLKEELLKAKTFDRNSIGTGKYFRGHNARDSLNQLRVSLNRSLMLPCIDNESEEELVDIDEQDARELCDQLSNLPSSSEDNLEEISGNKDSMEIKDKKLNSVGSNLGSFLKETEHEVHSEIHEPELSSNPSDGSSDSPQVRQDGPETVQDDQLQESSSKSSLSIIPCRQLPVLEDPTSCASPNIAKSLKKSTVSFSGPESPKNNSDKGSFRKCDVVRSSLQSSKVSSTDSLAACLHRGLQIINYHQRNSATEKQISGLSFEHLASISCKTVDKSDAAVQTTSEDKDTSDSVLCSACKKAVVIGYRVDDECDMQIVPIDDAGIPKGLKKEVVQVDKHKHEHQQSSIIEHNQETEILCHQGLVDGFNSMKELTNGEHMHSATEHALLKQNCRATSDMSERQALLREIESLRNQLKSYADASTSNCLLEQIRNGGATDIPSPYKREEFEKERQRWTESESRWICLTEELRLDLESKRLLAETKDAQLSFERKCTAELDDALQRAILGHARIIEHYAELQEKYDGLLGRHRKVMEGIADVKKAAQRAGTKGRGSAFVNALAAELSALRVEREKERAHLKEQNRSLKVQFRDTAEAVHAAGELLVRLREAEEAVALAEEKSGQAEQEAERLRKQMEKLKKKHAMEMDTMKHYLAESRLPECALKPHHREESDSVEENRAAVRDDDQAWRAAFRPSYQ